MLIFFGILQGGHYNVQSFPCILNQILNLLAMEHLKKQVSHETHFEKCWFKEHSWGLNMGNKMRARDRGESHLRSLSQQRTSSSSKMTHQRQKNSSSVISRSYQEVNTLRGSGWEISNPVGKILPNLLASSHDLPFTHGKSQMCSNSSNFKLKNLKNRLNFTCS